MKHINLLAFFIILINIFFCLKFTNRKKESGDQSKSDLGSERLPKNLHINLEGNEFNREIEKDVNEKIWNIKENLIQGNTNFNMKKRNWLNQISIQNLRLSQMALNTEKNNELIKKFY